MCCWGIFNLIAVLLIFFLSVWPDFDAVLTFVQADCKVQVTDPHGMQLPLPHPQV